MFRAEDPRIFADRIAFAYHGRRMCEVRVHRSGLESFNWFAVGYRDRRMCEDS